MNIDRTPRRVVKSLCILAVLLGGLSVARAEKIDIQVHYVEVPAAMQPTVDLTLLDRMEKAEVIKLDHVNTELGQKVTISSGKDFPVEGQPPVFTGVIIHITPSKEGEAISYTIDAEETRFAGYANLRKAFATPEAPAFTTRKVFGLRGTAMLGLAQMVELRPHSDPLSDSRTKVFLIIKFTAVAE